MLPRTGLAPSSISCVSDRRPPLAADRGLPDGSANSSRNHISGVGLQLDHVFRNCKVEQVLAFNSS